MIKEWERTYVKKKGEQQVTLDQCCVLWTAEKHIFPAPDQLHPADLQTEFEQNSTNTWYDAQKACAA